MRNVFCAAFALGLMAFAVPGHAVEPSGKVIAVVQSAEIDGVTGQKVLQPEAPVFSGDRVDTGPIGEAQIRFRDDTKLVVGPNSSLVIDAFVFDSSGNAQKFTINTVKGAFRFITGNSPKDAYTILTPTATIGVRGTEFDVSVEAEGTTRVANFEGITRICRRTADGSLIDCKETLDPCTLTVIRSQTQDVRQLSNADAAFKTRQLKYYFRYVRNQSMLLDDFKVDVEKCLIAAVDPGSPGGGGGPPPEPPPPFVPPTPGAPQIPTVTLPPPPQAPAIRSHDRPVYNHGSVLRP